MSVSSLTCAAQGRQQHLTDHAEVIKYASSFVSQMVVLDFQRLPFALVVSNRSSLTIGNVILRGLAPELAGCGSTPVVLLWPQSSDLNVVLASTPGQSVEPGCWLPTRIKPGLLRPLDG